MAKNHKSFVSKPFYPGGPAALSAFVNKHLNYPAAAREAGVEGRVSVRYTLDYTGKVVEARIKKGLGYGCDEEALRVVRLLRFRVPQSRKKKVRVHQDLNVRFRLPQQAPAPSRSTAGPQKITYTVVTEDKESSEGYGYTINW